MVASEQRQGAAPDGLRTRQAGMVHFHLLSRRMPSLLETRDRMRTKGKAPKTILIALARQLLVILGAVPRKGTLLAA